MQNLNFGRWLERLGFKTVVSPPVLHTVQPVALVADHRQLVSPALRASGVAGGVFTSTAVIGFTALVVQTPVPLWALVRWDPVSGSNSQGAIRIGIGASPALALPQPCVVQEFAGDVLSSWNMGEFAAAAGADIPQFKMPINNVSTALPWLFVPAGGFMAVNAQAAGTQCVASAWFYELPSEGGQ